MSAIFNDDRTHRFVLERGAPDTPYVLFIGLNPSTAAEDVEDATTRRLTTFAAGWGFRRWKIVNLSALVSTDPKGLRDYHPPRSIRAQEKLHLRHAIAGAHRVVACWGAGVKYLREQDREELPEWLIRYACGRLLCFGKTKGGHPKHPLYLRGDTELETYP